MLKTFLMIAVAVALGTVLGFAGALAIGGQHMNDPEEVSSRSVEPFRSTTGPVGHISNRGNSRVDALNRELQTVKAQVRGLAEARATASSASAEQTNPGRQDEEKVEHEPELMPGEDFRRRVDRMDSAFAADPVDSRWATEAEEEIAEYADAQLSEAASIEDVVCAGRMCRTELVFRDAKGIDTVLAPTDEHAPLARGGRTIIDPADPRHVIVYSAREGTKFFRTLRELESADRTH